LNKLDCPNCSPSYLRPGKLIEVNKLGPGMVCSYCGRDFIMSNIDYFNKKQMRWDNYFRTICKAVASKSPCLSRNIGAILVRDNSIVSTGYNGPARGYPHCDAILQPMEDIQIEGEAHFSRSCPRRAKGYASGEGLHECPAAHAEGNCVANAARNGVSTIGTTLYMNCIIPCKDCAIILVNAGVKEIVIDDKTPYHEMSIKILEKGNIKVREFRL